MVRAPWGRRLWAAVVASCALAFLALPQAAGAVSYGIGDAPSVCGSWGANSCNSWSYGFASYYSGSGAAAFTQLKNNLPLRYVRVFAPYDAIYVANTSAGGCRFSYDYSSHKSSQYPSGGGPGSAYFRLAQDLKDAHAAGVQVLVALTQATSGGQQHDGVAATPDPTAVGPAGPAAVSTVDGQHYSCGVQGLTSTLHRQGLQVAEWEAWNEPDGAGAYNGALATACTSLPNNCGGVYNSGAGLCGSSTYTQCGPLEAAGLYLSLTNTLRQWSAQYGWPLTPVAAATLSWPSTGYFNAYLKQLTTVLGQWPAYLSFHAYGDVTGAGHVQSYNFTRDIYNSYAAAARPQPAAWITEAAIGLADGDRSYGGQSITCDNGESDDTGTLGACVDGNVASQQNSAADFLGLASSGSYSPGQITEIFWYQLQPANASTGWDSGLLAPPQEPGGTWAQASPDGIYGSNPQATGLRPSFCVLARLPTTSCGGAIEASDWSIQPRPVSGSLTAGSLTVSAVSGDQSGLVNGDFVTGPGIASGTVIASGAGSSSWTLSQAATASGAGNLIASG